MNEASTTALPPTLSTTIGGCSSRALASMSWFEQVEASLSSPQRWRSQDGKSPHIQYPLHQLPECLGPQALSDVDLERTRGIFDSGEGKRMLPEPAGFSCPVRKTGEIRSGGFL